MQTVGKQFQLNRIKEYTPFLGEEVGHIGAPYEENSMDPTVNMNERYNTTYIRYEGCNTRDGIDLLPLRWICNPAEQS